MPHEILTLQIGQCGNAIGYEFWKTLCVEHGMSADGLIAAGEDRLSGVDNRDCFFYECEDGRYTPRCLLLDLEPRVINSIKTSEYGQLFNKWNMFVGTDGGGAGNNWASGYSQACRLADTLLDMISRETEVMDSMEACMLSHSITGGSGSGMGSYILELLADSYPKKLIQTYSVFPTSQQVSVSNNGSCSMYISTEDLDLLTPYCDVVVEPYNSLLTLKALSHYTESVVVLDNIALHSILSSHHWSQQPSFANVNTIVSRVMAASTAPVRLPGVMYTTLNEILSPLIPIHQLHFLMTGCTPLYPYMKNVPHAKTSVVSVMHKLLKLKNMMVSLPQDNQLVHAFLSVFNVIQYNKDFEIWKTGENIYEVAKRLTYVPCMSPVYNVAMCPQSPFVQLPCGTISALVIANHTAILKFFDRIISQFTKLFKRNAYIEQMKNLSGFDNLEDEMEDCKNIVEDLCSEYKAVTTKSYTKKSTIF